VDLNHAMAEPVEDGDLNHVTAAGTAEGPKAAEAKRVRDAAAGLVSQALILPILKQIRRSPWGTNPIFGGGMGEKAFGPEFDMQIADRIARSPRMGATNALTERLMKRTTVQGLDVNG
jgi:hypothetical protein